MSPSLGFIGAGNMGSALISAFLTSENILRANLKICDRSSGKLEYFRKMGIQVSEDPNVVIRGSDIIFLAIKPQDVQTFFGSVRDSLRKNVLLVSIAAGISIHFLQKISDISKVIRVMPNTPALVKMAVAGMFPSKEVEKKEYEYVKNLFHTCGVTIDCTSEEQIDAITALSGSGPAYFFRILEIFSQKAQKFGFSESDAKNIALGTLRGTGELAQQSEDFFQTLREKVTSKGGTTEAALKKFEELRLENVLNAGIQAAYERAREISNKQ
ncbi:pyrroline-5-carboxylate reductase [Candidatus Peregrinibacteria bacterium]|nr:pyrroline-5-carboxylate reductase [Candidatus Peregrinibacteria bacterium]